MHSEFLVDAVGYHKIKGVPITKGEIREALERLQALHENHLLLHYYAIFLPKMKICRKAKR